MAQLVKAETIKISEDWKPFRVGPRQDRIRAMSTPEGIGDRLRAVAFAEIQARDGFRFGLETFPEAHPELRGYWERFATMEEEHAQLLIDRALEVGADLGERVVVPNLWQMFIQAKDADFFLYLISTAEARGLEVGRMMVEPMRAVDPISAAIFDKIADDEVEHIEAAQKFLGKLDVEALKVRAQAIR